jgi:hypothetical protein
MYLAAVLAGLSLLHAAPAHRPNEPCAKPASASITAANRLVRVWRSDDTEEQSHWTACARQSGQRTVVAQRDTEVYEGGPYPLAVELAGRYVGVLQISASDHYGTDVETVVTLYNAVSGTRRRGVFPYNPNATSLSGLRVDAAGRVLFRESSCVGPCHGPADATWTVWSMDRRGCTVLESGTDEVHDLKLHDGIASWTRTGTVRSAVIPRP